MNEKEFSHIGCKPRNGIHYIQGNDFSSKDFLHPSHRHASSRAEPEKMAVEQTLSEEDADEASPPSVRLTSGFEKAMLKLKKSTLVKEKVN